MPSTWKARIPVYLCIDGAHVKWLTAREGSEQLGSEQRYRYTWQLPAARTASIDSLSLSLSLFPLFCIRYLRSTFLVSSLSPTVGGAGASAPSILHRRHEPFERILLVPIAYTTQITLHTVNRTYPRVFLLSRWSFRKWYRFSFSSTTNVEMK